MNLLFICSNVQERSHTSTIAPLGPLPEDSSFVAAARATIPPPRERLTTATVKGRGRARGRRTGNGQGRGRATVEVQSQANKRTTSRKRGRIAEASSTRATTAYVDANPMDRRSRGTYRSNPGSAQIIPDLNATIDADEVAVTQNAPRNPCCQFECTSYTDYCQYHQF
jgi:hypothetical protein